MPNLHELENAMPVAPLRSLLCRPQRKWGAASMTTW